jgi:nitrogen regulatory protein PII
MKRVEALIRAFKLSEVTLAIRRIPISGATATELWDTGSGPGGGSLAMVKLEIVVHDDLVARVVSTIRSAAGERLAGGALVLVEPVMAVTGLPNGEIDEAAIG